MSFRAVRLFIDKGGAINWGTNTGSQYEVNDVASSPILPNANIGNWSVDASGNLFGLNGTDLCKFNGADGLLPIRLVWDFGDTTQISINSFINTFVINNTVERPTLSGTYIQLDKASTGSYFKPSMFGFAIIDTGGYADDGTQSGTITHYQIALLPLMQSIENTGEVAHVSFDWQDSGGKFGSNFGDETDGVIGFIFVDKVNKQIETRNFICYSGVSYVSSDRHGIYAGVRERQFGLSSITAFGGGSSAAGRMALGGYSSDATFKNYRLALSNTDGRIINDIDETHISFADNVKSTISNYADAYMYPIVGSYGGNGILNNSAWCRLDNISVPCTKTLG